MLTGRTNFLFVGEIEKDRSLDSVNLKLRSRSQYVIAFLDSLRKVALIFCLQHYKNAFLFFERQFALYVLATLKSAKVGNANLGAKFSVFWMGLQKLKCIWK